MSQFPFPEIIDSSIRADFVTCPRKFYYSRIHSFAKRATNIHLKFGGCFAKGLEAYRREYWGGGGDAEAALIAGVRTIILAWGEDDTEIQHVKSVYSCVDALAAYFEQWPPDRDLYEPLVVEGKPQVECTFALPIPGTEHPETGEPILYAGRYDMLATRRSAPGQLYIEDDKTTGALGDSWIGQWRLRAQFTGYSWAAREHGLRTHGVIVRGVGILKTQITFAEVLTFRADWQIEQWLGQLQRDVRRMIAAWRENEWDQNLDHACSSFGGCTFVDLCASKEPERWFNQYVVAPWNPLERPD